MHVHVHHLAYELEGSACQRQLPQTSLPQQLVARHPLRIQRILLMPCSCLCDMCYEQLVVYNCMRGPLTCSLCVKNTCLFRAGQHTPA